MSKFLDLSGVTFLWEKVKSHVSDQLTEQLQNELEVPNGIATLDSNGKLKSEQIPDLKTINNQSILGTGNIAIDLGLYKVVESLPTTDVDPNKIYLIVNNGAPEANQYSEHIYNNGKWELLGQYKADVDLTPYAKKAEIGAYVTGVTAGAHTSNTVVLNVASKDATTNAAKQPTQITLMEASATAAGIMTTDNWNKLKGIADKATADSALTEDELVEVLV